MKQKKATFDRLKIIKEEVMGKNKVFYGPGRCPLTENVYIFLVPENSQNSPCLHAPPSQITVLWNHKSKKIVYAFAFDRTETAMTK